jgi:organic radical activating enzyme
MDRQKHQHSVNQNPLNTQITLATMPDGTPEIFTSVQGEGPMSGRFSLFVRLSECNLFCRWCDTAYTWRWTPKHEHEDDTVYRRQQWQIRMSVQELVENITGRGINSVIFTGGEPLLQHKALLHVMRDSRAISENLEFEFETNGTISPPREFLDLCSLIVVSPKLENSGMKSSVRIVGALAKLLEAPQVVLKFVVESDRDFEEIRSLQLQFGIAAHRIWIMPCGRTAEVTAQIGRAIIDRLILSGYNYSPRLHLALFGEKQGT